MHAAIIIGLAAAAATVQQAPSLPSAGPATFDIAGVKLGMTPDAVRRAIVAVGYRIDHTDTTNSFQDNVAVEAAHAQGRVPAYGKATSVGRIWAVGPHAEFLTVDFDQWPGGAFVGAVDLAIKPERQTLAALQSQIEGKYGKPNLKTDSLSFQWCTPGERGCDRMSVPQLPTLQVGYATPYTVRLRENGQVASQLNAAFKASVEARAPKSERSAF